MKVLFFAHSAQWAGRREIEIALPDPVPLANVLERPEFSPLKGRLQGTRFAVNEELAGPEALLRDSDVLAVLPPVSGG